MTTRHLVAGLQTTLHCQVNLDHLQHAGRQFVALRQFLALLFESKIELMTLLLQRLFGLLKVDCIGLIGQTNIEPLPFIEVGQVLSSNLGAFGKLAWTAINGFTHQDLFNTIERIFFNNTQLIVQVLTIATQFIVDNRLRTLVAFDAFTCEDLNVDHRTNHARRNTQRRIFHVGGFLTENGTQQFFFRGQLGFTFGCNLTYQHIVGTHFSTNMNNAGVIQTVQLDFRQIADVACDFFGTQFGVTRHNREFFNVNRSIAVVGHYIFGDQNRVFEVVAVPGHERDQHVLTQRQFTQVG